MCDYCVMDGWRPLLFSRPLLNAPRLWRRSPTRESVVAICGKTRIACKGSSGGDRVDTAFVVGRAWAEGDPGIENEYWYDHS